MHKKQGGLKPEFWLVKQSYKLPDVFNVPTWREASKHGRQLQHNNERNEGKQRGKNILQAGWWYFIFRERKEVEYKDPSKAWEAYWAVALGIRMAFPKAHVWPPFTGKYRISVLSLLGFLQCILQNYTLLKLAAFQLTLKSVTLFRIGPHQKNDLAAPTHFPAPGYWINWF